MYTIPIHIVDLIHRRQTASEIKLYVGTFYLCLRFVVLIHIHACISTRCVGQIKRTIMPKWFQSNIIICQIDTNKTENVSVSHMFSINLRYTSRCVATLTKHNYKLTSNTRIGSRKYFGQM